MLGHNSPLKFINDNEDGRLQNLEYYEILDSQPENQFDVISEIAAGIFECSFATITFVGKENLLFKSNYGDLSFDKKRENSLFELAIQSQHSISFENLQNQKPEFITLEPPFLKEIAFFASAPIISSNGYVLGSIAVMDKAAKNPTALQLKMLDKLAALVIDKLENRIAVRNILRLNDDRLNLLVHDLKNPVTTISLQSELLGRLPGTNDKISLVANKIHNQSKNIVDRLNHILSSGVRVNGSFKLRKTKLDLVDILKQVNQDLSSALKNKNQTLFIKNADSMEIYGDEQKLIEVFKNLIDNAIKFSPIDTKIEVYAYTVDNKIAVEIKDKGVGLSAEDLTKIFTKFAHIDSFPTHNENTNKLGLATAKMLIDMHHGLLSASSEGKNKGTTFYVELPVK